MIPGPPTLYQTLLNHPRFDRSWSTRAVPGGHRRRWWCPSSWSSPWSEQLGFETVLTAWPWLTEVPGVVTVCRREDGAETIATTSGRAIPASRLVIGSRRQPVGPDRARRGPGAGLQRHAGVLRGPGSRPPRPSILTDGCTPATSARSTPAATRHHRPHQTCSSSGGFNAYPAEIEQLGAPIPTSPRSPSSACRRAGWEVGVAFVVPTAGAELDGDAVISWAREGQPQGPRRSRSSTPHRSTPA